MKTILFLALMCCGCCASAQAIDPFGLSDCANGRCPVVKAVAQAPAAIVQSFVNAPAKIVNSMRSNDCGCGGNCGQVGCVCAPVATALRGAAISPVRSRLFFFRRGR